MAQEDASPYNAKKAELRAAWEAYREAVEQAREREATVLKWGERLLQRIEAGENISLSEYLLDSALDSALAASRRRAIEAGVRFDRISRELAELAEKRRR